MPSKRKYKKPINASKVVIDGIEFDSKIEGYMYRLLRDNKIPHKVHEEFTILSDEGSYKGEVYVRPQRRSKELVSTKNSKSIKRRAYTPDFVAKGRVPNWVIEVKGRKLGDFSLRWSLFKRKIKNSGTDLFMPVTKEDCNQVIEIIKSKYYE